MIKKVLVLDTSILCAALNVPGKETCGTTDDVWDQQRIRHVLTDEEQ